MLKDKCGVYGISVILTEESYTSKASFLDFDTLPVYGKDDKKVKFSGRRIKRGLYKSGNGTLLNADINGSLNILRKAIENDDLLSDLIEDAQFIHHCRSPLTVNVCVK
jgi:putative transposase